MQVTESLNEGLKREYNVVVSAGDVDKQINQRLEEIGKTAKMPGFRPGHVPMNVLKKKHGQAILGEILEQMVNTSSQKVYDEKNIRPALQPKIEITSFDEGKNLEYTIKVELYPDVPELKTNNITIESYEIAVTDKEIKEGLERVAQANLEYVAVKDKAKKAANGDTVLIDFLGTIEDVPFEGGEGKDFTLTLGSGQFIPGYEDQLVGKKAGDTVDVKVNFPEQYHAADLAGKPAVFKTTIKEIQEPTEPKVNEDLAKKLAFESLDDLKEQVKKQIADDYENLVRTYSKKQLFDHLDSSYAFDIPEGMVEIEFNALWDQVTKEQGEKLKGKEEEELREEYQDMANRRVRLGVLLVETGKRNDINVDDDEIRKAIYQQTSQFPGQEKAIIDFYRSNPEAVEQLKGPLLEDKVVDWLLEKVKVTKKKATSEEFVEIFKQADVNSIGDKKKKVEKKTDAKKKPAAKKKAAKK